MTTYDVHFQIVPEAEQEGSGGKVFTFGFTSAVGVKGPQKLVNRWLKCLMTPKGTDLLDETYGTGYAGLIGSNVSRRQDFTDAVALYVADCNAQITKFDQRTFPPADERLKSAALTSVVPRGAAGFDVYVSLKNMAGTLLTAQVPSGTFRP